MSEQRIVLSRFGIDHDANVTFVYGIVEGGTHFNLKNTRIVTILEPDTESDRQANTKCSQRHGLKPSEQKGTELFPLLSRWLLMTLVISSG